MCVRYFWKAAAFLVSLIKLLFFSFMDLRKYEEVTAPPVEEFCLITDNTYTRAEVQYLVLLELSSFDIVFSNHDD